MTSRNNICMELMRILWMKFITFCKIWGSYTDANEDITCLRRAISLYNWSSLKILGWRPCECVGIFFFLLWRMLRWFIVVIGVVVCWIVCCLECKCWLYNTSVNWNMGCDGGTIPKRDELVRKRKKPEQVSVCHLKLWFLTTVVPWCR